MSVRMGLIVIPIFILILSGFCWERQGFLWKAFATLTAFIY